MRSQKGVGMTSGEELEQCHAVMSRASTTTLVMSTLREKPNQLIKTHIWTLYNCLYVTFTGQAGLGVGSWPSSRTNAGSSTSEFDYTS